jgi:hypothetical protein
MPGHLSVNIAKISKTNGQLTGNYHDLTPLRLKATISDSIRDPSLLHTPEGGTGKISVASESSAPPMMMMMLLSFWAMVVLWYCPGLVPTSLRAREFLLQWANCTALQLEPYVPPGLQVVQCASLASSASSMHRPRRRQFGESANCRRRRRVWPPGHISMYIQSTYSFFPFFLVKLGSY